MGIPPPFVPPPFGMPPPVPPAVMEQWRGHGQAPFAPPGMEQWRGHAPQQQRAPKQRGRGSQARHNEGRFQRLNGNEAQRFGPYNVPQHRAQQQPWQNRGPPQPRQQGPPARQQQQGVQPQPVGFDQANVESVLLQHVAPALSALSHFLCNSQPGALGAAK